MDTVVKYFRMAIHTKVNISGINLMEKGNTNGITKITTLAIFQMVTEMEKERGSHAKKMEMSTKVTISRIKNKDKEDIFGVTVQFLKGISIKIKSKYLINFRDGEGKVIYTDGK